MNTILLFLGSFILKKPLYYSHHNMSNIHKELSNNIESIIIAQQYKDGYCDFTFNHPDDSSEMLRKIKLHFHRKKVLDAIDHNGLSILQKINIIKSDTSIMDEKMGSNILAGGLLDDWH
jgi:hypothetical protein